MSNHTPITILRGMGVLFFVSGLLGAAWFFVSALSSLGTEASLISRSVAIAAFLLGLSSLLSGVFLWALCLVFAVIAEGTLDNGYRLDELNRRVTHIATRSDAADIADLLREGGQADIPERRIKKVVR